MKTLLIIIVMTVVGTVVPLLARELLRLLLR